MHFSTISLLLNDSVEREVLGTMNGLSNLGGSVMKFMGPIFAGVMFAGFVNSEIWGARVGGEILYWCCFLSIRSMRSLLPNFTPLFNNTLTASIQRSPRSSLI